jgi:hypothetical protein
MAGTAGTAKLVGELPIHGHIGGIALRIHLLRLRMEDCIYPLCFQFLAVFCKSSRICLIVLIGAKLGGIHKDRSDHYLAFPAGFPHEGQMTLMQGPHGGNQAYGLALLAGSLCKVLDLIYGSQYYHCLSSSRYS